MVGGDGLGALSICSRQENGLSAVDEALGKTCVSYASVAVANARVY